MGGACIALCDHKMVELNIFIVMRKKKTLELLLWTLRVYFKLFRELFIEVPWESASEGLGAPEWWSVFKKHLFEEQEQVVLLCWKSSKWSRRPSLLNRVLTPCTAQEGKEIVSSLEAR